jgi:predicted dehydrogenase
MGADPRFEPVAFVDLIPQNLEGTLAKLPGIPTFSDVNEALKSVEADAAVICTPTRTHAPLSRLCFEKGLHVVVEKGMTMSYEEAVALVDDAEKAGVCFAVAQNYRYRGNERMMADLINDPSSPFHPGKIEIADYVHHRYRPDPRTLNYPFAMVWDMSCHHVDSLSCWLGPVERVTARSSNPSWSQYEHDADIHAILEYKSGAVCNYLLTHAATYAEWRIMLQGSEGALRLTERELFFAKRPAQFLGGSSEELVPVTPGPSTEQGVTNAFYDYVVNGIEPGISGRNNLDTLAVCELLVRSATEKRTIEAAELNAS